MRRHRARLPEVGEGTFPGVDIQLIVGVNLSMSPGLDILIAHSGPNGTNGTLLEDVTFDGTTLSSAMTARALPNVGPPRGRTVVVTAGAGMPNVAITFGTDAMATCVLGPC